MKIFVMVLIIGTSEVFFVGKLHELLGMENLILFGADT